MMIAMTDQPERPAAGALADAASTGEPGDFVCRRCGCACDAAGIRHRGGGPGMRACGKPPHPVLRSELAHEASSIAAAARARR